MDRNRFQQAAAELGLDLDDAALDRFAEFEDRLYKANEVMNLTRVPREDCWRRHFLDCLLIARFLPEGATVLDVGTGPGLPAWPLAAARPDCSVAAIDSSGKMLGFLRQNPLPNLEVVLARAEEWPVRERFDVVTGRAVAPLAAQLELSAGPCKVGGRVVPMRTPADCGEVPGAALLGLVRLEVVEVPLPNSDVVRAFPVYEKTAPTPRKYPRPWAEIRRKPL